MNKFSLAALGVALTIGVSASWAQVEVDVGEPWVRATVAQQSATGAFMRITAHEDAKLIRASSPVAGVVEVHEMAMDKDVMRMRAVPFLSLPAHKTVELKSGGYHVMLMDLKGQIKVGDQVPLTLVFEGKDGKRKSLELQAPARAMNSGMPAEGMQHQHGKH